MASTNAQRTDEGLSFLVDEYQPTRLPVLGSQQVEFGTEGWLNLARDYLTPRVAERRGSLRGLRLAVDEIYTDAPPHLKFPDGVAAIHIVIDDGELTVGAGTLDEPDVRVTGNYDQAATVYTGVYEQMPDRRERLTRELTHLYGEAIKVVGSPPTAPALLAVLEGLHDHLARHTKFNPDLDHRIANLGLTEHLARIEEDGYTIIEDAISQAYADEIHEALSRHFEDDAMKGVKKAAMLLQRGPVFEEMALHPHVYALHQKLLGPDMNLGHYIGSGKPAGVDTHAMHNDPPHPAPGTEGACFDCTAVWAISDFGEDDGPTIVVPGTHKLNRAPDADAADRAVKVLMPRGSIAMWHGALWHGAAVRTAPGLRMAVHHTHVRGFGRTFDNYLHIDPAILDRNPPAIGTLCGLDDIFMKNTSSGPNFDGYLG
jgi:hypothetical protein